MILDYQLIVRWKEHIKSLKDKSKKYINILKWVAGKSWGIPFRLWI